VAEPLPPHRDPARWDELIAGVSPETILVVIEREMGAALRAHCQPEDVWQETLAVAWRDRAQHDWTGTRAFRGWLVAIAKNRVKDVARAMTREKRGGDARPTLFSGMDVPEGATLSQLLPAGSSTPSRVAAHREEARIIAKALEALPEETREVVRLHLLEELKMDDVAARLGVAVHVARYRFLKGAEAYARALRSLRSGSGP
jgi:RNA polymerase sigma factor (sigma-70 family)